MPSVFISRNLKPTSPFQRLGKEWQVTAESLLEFQLVVVPILPTAAWYFFYSSKGAAFFLQQHAPPPAVKLACLGQGAASVLQDWGYHPSFVGNGNPADTAQQWLEQVRGSRVVFVQARQSRASVQQLLGDAVQARSIVTYDNQIRTTFELPRTDYLIFTSPLNFEAYRQRRLLDHRQRVIGIGPTTAVTFSAANVKEYRIAKTPSEAGIVQCLLNWEKDQPLEAVQ